MKFIRIFLGILLLLFTFGTGIAIRDEIYLRSVEANLPKLNTGMTKDEVIAIIGKPTNMEMTDGSGTVWCYGSSTWESWAYGEIYCGKHHLLMSGPNDDILWTIDGRR